MTAVPKNKFADRLALLHNKYDMSPIVTLAKLTLSNPLVGSLDCMSALCPLTDSSL